ncbi:SUKH-4 family immunity protein, partial [Nocardiopsis lucentensis]|uniref:SUKH-4 family immunity protein n=1 Tax=Nocardiopsis lucentensis TaxID=53441 RepID=UPI000592A430
DDEGLPFLWEIAAADPELLAVADRTRPERIELWDVHAYDRTVLDLHGYRMGDWHARYLWAVSAPLPDLVAAGERAEVGGLDEVAVPESGRRALDRFGLPGGLFAHRLGQEGRDGDLGDVGRLVYTHPSGDGEFWVERGTGRVALPWSDPASAAWVASSSVALVEMAWRWYWVDRILAEEDVHGGWDHQEADEAESDFRDLVRWIDPDSVFAQEFPLVDLL